MSDDDLIRRGDALREVAFWRDDWKVVRAHIRALPAVTAPQEMDEGEALLWDLLEEIDAQIDLAEEISPEFADKVQIALWSDTPAQPAPDVVGLPADVRQWPFYPIQMPFNADGKGPATIGVDAADIAYEVWDREFNTHASFNNLPDAINEAMRLSIAALAPAQPALTPKPVDDSLAADPAVKPTLAEALAVPEMKALVEAANEHIAFMEGTGLTFDFLGKLRAALRQIGGEA